MLVNWDGPKVVTWGLKNQFLIHNCRCIQKFVLKCACENGEKQRTTIGSGAFKKDPGDGTTASSHQKRNIQTQALC